jgi:pyrroline-5-carboxylate reductase
MPNTPMLVGKGASAISANDNVTKKDFQYICRLFSGISLVSVLEEENMNRVISVNGSSPAYVYAFIRGMLNGAIEQGIDEKQALPLILRTIEGAVKMVEKSDVSIDTLIERVCSPGGTTLEAMKVFSEKDFEKIIAEAMTACTNRADEITETL